MVKNAPANLGGTGDLGSNPELGRSPGEGDGSPLQYSRPGNPMDRGAWWATAHGITKSWTQMSSSAPNCIHVSPPSLSPLLCSLCQDHRKTVTLTQRPRPRGSVLKNAPACVRQTTPCQDTLELDVTGESSDGDLVFTCSSVPNASWILCIILILKFLLK